MWMRRGEVEGALDEDGVVDVVGEVGVFVPGRGEAGDVFVAHGEAVRQEPGA